jgi:hypothetical protein
MRRETATDTDPKAPSEESRNPKAVKLAPSVRAGKATTSWMHQQAMAKATGANNATVRPVPNRRGTREKLVGVGAELMPSNGEVERPAAGASEATPAHNLPAPAAPNHQPVPARSNDC